MGCICDIFKKRKFSRVGHADIGCKRPMELNNAQKTAIRNNWRVLNSQIANIGVFTFISMFESRPELKETFESFKGKDVHEIHNTGLLRKHALRVMSTIDKCISRLDQPSSMTSTLRKIGVHHLQYKVPVEYLEAQQVRENEMCMRLLKTDEKMRNVQRTRSCHCKKLLDIDIDACELTIILPHFLEAIKPQLEAFWCDDLEDAWTRLFDMILYHIKEGMFRNDNYDTMSISGTVT